MFPKDGPTSPLDLDRFDDLSLVDDEDVPQLRRTKVAWQRDQGIIESAKLNGHDPWTYLKDVFEWLPTLKQRNLAQLLPRNWQPPGHAAVTDSAPVATAS